MFVWSFSVKANMLLDVYRHVTEGLCEPARGKRDYEKLCAWPDKLSYSGLPKYLDFKSLPY